MESNLILVPHVHRVVMMLVTLHHCHCIVRSVVQAILPRILCRMLIIHPLHPRRMLVPPYRTRFNLHCGIEFCRARRVL